MLYQLKNHFIASFSPKSPPHEHGAILLLVTVLLSALFGTAALCVDVGVVRAIKNKMQYGVDAAALAAVLEIATAEDEIYPSVIQSEAMRYALENGIRSSEIHDAMGQAGVEVGNWSFDNGTFQAAAQPFNAVRVRARRRVPLFFGPVLGQHSMSPVVEAIAVASGAGSANCIIPFGVELSYINNVVYDDVVTVDFVNSGNWGKLDIGGVNMSDPNNFEAAMQGDTCSGPVSIGDTVDQATGFSGLSPCMQWRIQNNPFIIVPIVDTFGNGSSPTDIVAFVEFEVLSQTGHGGGVCRTQGGGNNGGRNNGGGNGAGWTADLRYVRSLGGSGAGGPLSGPFLLSRSLLCICGDGTSHCAKCGGS